MPFFLATSSTPLATSVKNGFEASSRLRGCDELGGVGRQAVMRPKPPAFLEQPQTGHIRQQPDGVLDAELIGHVGVEGRRGGHWRGQLAAHERPSTAGDVDRASIASQWGAGDGAGSFVTRCRDDTYAVDARVHPAHRP
jgi:hypothetical protein